VGAILALKLGAGSLTRLDGLAKVLFVFVLDILHHVQELLPFNHTVGVLVNFLEHGLDLLRGDLSVTEVAQH
jgi:hypothetical protein